MIDESVFSYLAILLAMLFLPAANANTLAHSERGYQVWASQDDIKSLVVRRYPKNLIIKDYNTKDKKFLDGFTISSIEETKVYRESYTVEKWGK